MLNLKTKTPVMLWMVISTRARFFRGPTAVENPGKVVLEDRGIVLKDWGKGEKVTGAKIMQGLIWMDRRLCHGRIFLR
jgi:hypothetical protein